MGFIAFASFDTVVFIPYVFTFITIFGWANVKGKKSFPRIHNYLLLLRIGCSRLEKAMISFV